MTKPKKKRGSLHAFLDSVRDKGHLNDAAAIGPLVRYSASEVSHPGAQYDDDV
jgi:hypothetical protein